MRVVVRVVVRARATKEAKRTQHVIKRQRRALVQPGQRVDPSELTRALSLRPLEPGC